MIYLDHNATTPISEAALARMTELQRRGYANPSSSHRAARLPREAVAEARREVAALVGARPSEVIFTAGGTEADVTAVWSAVAAARRRSPARPAVIAVVETAHHALLHSARLYADLGLAEVREVRVDARGHVDMEGLQAALAGVDLFCSMWANNETGTVADLAALAPAVQESGARWHVDAVQAAGKVAVDLGAGPAQAVDSIALAAHKLHGPKGVGALVWRGAPGVTPLLPGGAQEAGRRSGTLNAPAIAAFGVAAAEAAARLKASVGGATTAARRDRLQSAILEMAPQSVVNGDPERRLPNTLNLSMRLGERWLDGEDLMLELDRRGVAVSTGAACASGGRSPSHVLLAMGRSPAQAHASLRLSLSHATTDAELDDALAAMAEVLDEARRGEGEE